MPSSNIELLRPCGLEFPNGKEFGEWGPMWGYHFDDLGIWVKGQVNHLGQHLGQHGGVDIICPVGTILKSPGSGMVVGAGWQDANDKKRGYGLRVIIELNDPLGLILTGGHFSELWPKEGDKIQRGQPIGLSGDTGNAAGPHSHWQLEKPGPYPRIPLNFIWIGGT